MDSMWNFIKQVGIYVVFKNLETDDKYYKFISAHLNFYLLASS